MQEKMWRSVNREGWPSGPWDAEPDKVQFTDPKTNLPCLAVRHPSLGHWYGYVGVPPEHPLFGREYHDNINVSVHGGLTFFDVYQPGSDEGKGVCHIPDPGESEHVWWFGFDCAHCDDLGPKDTPFYPHFRNQEYRTLDYVKQECADLAEQLHNLA